MPKFLHELSERERCSFNIIGHGLPESAAALSASRISDDTKLHAEII